MNERRGGGGGGSKVALGCQDVTCAFSLASAFSVTFENIKHKIRLLYLTTSMENSSFCLKVWSGMFAAITSKDVHVDLLYFCLSGMAIFGTWTFRKLFNLYYLFQTFHFFSSSFFKLHFVHLILWKFSLVIFFPLFSQIYDALSHFISSILFSTLSFDKTTTSK